MADLVAAESPAYTTSDDVDDYKRYGAEITLYEREFKQWESRVKKILRLYRDADNKNGQKKRFNIYWSNVQTLKPALYARMPQPECSRRFKDQDKVGRVASEVLERCISYTLEMTDFDGAMKRCVDDRLHAARAVLWHRNVTEFEAMPDVIDEVTGEPVEQIAHEEVIPEYVHWKDFGHNIARTWDEVTVVWRRVAMTRRELVERFGEVGQKIPLDHEPGGLKAEFKTEGLKKAMIYEIWDKSKRQVAFYSKHWPSLIEVNPDPLKLTNFWPCPPPLYGTLTNDSLVPAPDYALYQTQAQEIETMTARINSLQKALKVAGVYDSSAPELARLLGEGYENKMIPVEEWAPLAEKGGLKGAVDWFPVETIAEVLIGLYEARDKAKQDLYEITGIADIIRGNSDPNETATAQQIKGRFAVLRISDAQQAVQDFARDSIRIIAEIIAEHFSLETIKQISGVQLLTDAEKALVGRLQELRLPVPPKAMEAMEEPSWEEVHELLSHETLRNFRIEVESDSTIRTDEEADRAERTEFLNVVGGYLQQAVAAAQQVPELKPLLAELLMFGVRGHKAGRSIEPMFEQAMKEMQKPQPPQPDPEMAKIQAQGQLEQQKLAQEKELTIAEQQAQAAQEQATQSLADQRAQREHEREMIEMRYKTDREIEAAREKALIDAATKVEVARISAVNDQAAREHEERTQPPEAKSEPASAPAEASGREKELDKAKDLVTALAELKKAG